MNEYNDKLEIIINNYKKELAEKKDYNKIQNYLKSKQNEIFRFDG
jgi:hypothetical protein